MFTSNTRETACIMKARSSDRGGVGMPVTIERKSTDELHERLEKALARVDMDYSALAELASRYMLTPEELAVWDEVQAIRFLLGDE